MRRRAWPLDSAAKAVAGTRTAVLVYLGTRVLLLTLAAIDAAVEHQSLGSAMGHWDGVWYARLALHGYPTHLVSHASTLGFFPLFPLLIWVVMQLGLHSAVAAGAVISGIGGLIATVLVQRLASGWWGAASGRRAAVLFCLFPGSVVFSMSYSEGLLIPLAAGCLLALERRRWLLAGALAGVATATGADAIALVVVCALASIIAVGSASRRSARETSGHTVHNARASLAAPLLSFTGIAAFGLFLWEWTGTPFATLDTQHRGWHEGLDPLALVHQGQLFASQLAKLNLSSPTLDLSPAAALLGTVVLIAGVVLLLRRPRRASIEAIVWAILVGALAVFSAHVGPNARMLETAFPALIVFAHRFRGRAYAWLLAADGLLLVVMSALTFTGHSLTP